MAILGKAFERNIFDTATSQGSLSRSNNIRKGKWRFALRNATSTIIKPCNNNGINIVKTMEHYSITLIHIYKCPLHYRFFFCLNSKCAMGHAFSAYVRSMVTSLHQKKVSHVETMWGIKYGCLAQGANALTTRLPPYL